MLTCLRTGLLILFVSFLFACGGGGSGSSGSQPNRAGDNTPPPAATDPDPAPAPVLPDDIEPPHPVAADMTTSVFLPVLDQANLFYDGAGVASLMSVWSEQDGQIVYSLNHPGERVEYLTSTAGAVGLKGLVLQVVEGASPAYLTVDFAEPRPIVGNTNSFDTRGDAQVRISGIPGFATIPVRMEADRQISGDRLAVPPFDVLQPARKVRLRLRLSLTLDQQAVALVAAPALLSPMDVYVWFVPGVGIAKISYNTWESVLTNTQGVDEPLVFYFSQVVAQFTHPAPRPVLMDGATLTDDGWVPEIYYRTQNDDWLNVTFDSPGLWRAHISRVNLPRGVHAATVRFRKGDDTMDVVVNTLVVL